MAPTLDAKKRQALAARLDFYRELGMHDFYRHAQAPASDEQLIALPDKAQNPEPADLHSFQADPPAGDPVAALRAIREDIGDCTRCGLSRGRKNIVFGVGNPKADIMFIGEGPGADEDEQGEPFVGRAGQLLNNMIAATGIRREDVYIANVVKCRPPQNRAPERDEIETCSPFLMRQVDVIRPKIIVALGATAAKTLLGISDSMASLRGRLYDFRGTKLAVTYHPAFLLRDPRQKKEAWKDLQMVMNFLGMPAKK